MRPGSRVYLLPEVKDAVSDGVIADLCSDLVPKITCQVY